MLPFCHYFFFIYVEKNIIILKLLHMDIEGRKKRLRVIYEQYKRDAAEFKKAAACVIGCADFCTDVGKFDITTLEGIIIHEQIALFEEPLKSEITAKLAQNKAEGEQQ